MEPPLIEIKDLHLRYPSSPLRTFTLKDRLFNLLRFRKSADLLHDVHALKGVSLAVGKGERIGIIGPNGAGKSTLLKVTAGVYPPHEGTVVVRGDVRSLFEINLGFEYEATGRANIMYRGLLLGQRPREIRAKEDEVVDFAGLGEFIDYPVKAYSAGMLIRLAFAISTAFEADILLLDEVLGAGDAAFARKARTRISELISKAKSLILVSHDLGSVRELCSRAILLEHGRIVEDGPPGEVVERYLKRAEAGTGQSPGEILS